MYLNIYIYSNKCTILKIQVATDKYSNILTVFLEPIPR